MRISQASASASPAPAAGPGSAAIVGFRHRHQRTGQGALLGSQVGNAVLERYFGLVGIVAHALDVAAGAKGRARACYQQRADVGIVAALLDHPPQRGREVIRERIARLGAVERDERDAVPDFAQ